MNTKITMIYAFSSFVVLAQIVSTVYNSSLVVFHGQEVAQLQSQKKQLLQEKAQLKKQIAEHTSLSQIASAALTQDYTNIQTHFVVDTTTIAVALR